MRRFTALKILNKTLLAPMLRSNWIVIIKRRRIIYIYYPEPGEHRLSCIVANVNMLYGIRRLASNLTILYEGDQVRLIKYMPKEILRRKISGQVAIDANSFVGVRFADRPDIMTRINETHHVFDAVEKISGEPVYSRQQLNGKVIIPKAENEAD